MKIRNNPWKHIIEDDFYESDDFKYFCALAANICKTIKPHEKVIETQTLDVFKLKYEQKALKYLQMLAPEKVELYKRFQLDIQAVGVEESSQNFIHVDRHDKLLSIVVYGYPERHIGTHVGKTRESLKPLEWKQNRALIFSRSDDTWHSFSTWGLGPRVTFNINLYR